MNTTYDVSRPKETIKYLRKYHPSRIKVKSFDAANIDEIIDDITNLQEVAEMIDNESIYNCITSTTIDTVYDVYELHGTYEDVTSARKKILEKAGIEPIYDVYDKVTDVSVSVLVNDYMSTTFINKDMAIELAEKEEELSYIAVFNDITVLGTYDQEEFVIITRDTAFIEEITLYSKSVYDYRI